MNYFEFYDIPVSFKIDKSVLKKKYLVKSKKFHPDFYTNESPSKQEEIMQVFMPLVEVFTNYYAQIGEEQPLVKARFLLAIFDGIGIHYVMDPQSFPLDETRDLIINLL